MKVWILTNGERFEGSRIVGVYHSRLNALNVIPSGFVLHPTIPDYWEDDRCDYYSLKEYEVK